MTLADLHVMPTPEAVAALVDSHGRHAALERWGWLDQSSIWKLTTEGRRRAGRTRTPGVLHCLGSGHDLVSRTWDGPEVRSPRLTSSIAAAALGISAGRLNGAARWPIAASAF